MQHFTHLELDSCYLCFTVAGFEEQHETMFKRNFWNKKGSKESNSFSFSARDGEEWPSDDSDSDEDEDTKPIRCLSIIFIFTYCEENGGNFNCSSYRD